MLNKDDEWDVSPARLVFTALRPPCEESTSATLQKGAMLEGRPRQGPQAGGVRVFPASTHSGRSSEDKKKQSGDNTHPTRIASYTHCAPLLALFPPQASSGLTPAPDTLPGSGHPGSPLVPGAPGPE